MRKITLLLLTILATSFIVGCNDTTESKKSNDTEQTLDKVQVDFYENYPDVTENPVATIEMMTGEKIVIELKPMVAPNTVANFISLANSGFYDGLIFHRVIEGFMIQGGDPLGNGLGGPDYSIPGEFSSNGFDNSLTHEPGVISMARSQSPDSAGSQFFIMHQQAEHLDGEYAGFGQVIEGMDIVDAIAQVETDNNNDAPVEEQKIKSVSVNTYDVNYPDPIKK